MGLSLTALWLGTGIAYIGGNVGWAAFVQLPAEELGSFLEGAFAPLAFLWLVIGYFLQQQELIQNTRAIRAQAEEIGRTAEQAIIQSEKLAASESHARQEATLKLAEAVRQQLGGISGMLYISSHGETGITSRPLTADNCSPSKQGDVEAFSRELLGALVDLSTDAERFDRFIN